MNVLVHGIDLVPVCRIAEMVAEHGDHFIERCFTEPERQAAANTAPEVAAQKYAARFAAKEATLKALGTGLTGGITWQDIGVVRSDGAPTVELSGRAAEVADAAGIDTWRLSLSHTADMAIASVIGLGG